MKRALLLVLAFVSVALLGFGPSYTPPPFDLVPVGGSLANALQDYPTVTIDDIKIAGRCVDVGNLPNNTTKLIAHNTFDLGLVIWLFGAYTDGTDHFAVSAYIERDTAGLPELMTTIDSTNIKINARKDWSAFTGVVCFYYSRT